MTFVALGRIGTEVYADNLLAALEGTQTYGNY
jgi:hypothetical protein